MSSYKEIVTKTVIGKGKKNTTADFKVIPEQKPDTVLGCWVINHQFKGINEGGKVNVNGTFDINVWYSYDSDTKTAVSSKKFSYNDTMNVALRENSDLSGNPEIIVRSLKQPTVTNVSVNEGTVQMNVEKELGVEVIGDAKVKIMVEDEEDDYDIISDNETQVKEADFEEIENVEEDFLK